MKALNDIPDCLSLDEDGGLVFGGIRCDELVRDRRTPLYAYSAAQIRANYRRMAGALEEHLSAQWRIFYAYKGNPSPAVCAMLHTEGAGAEVVSCGVRGAFRGNAGRSRVQWGLMGVARERHGEAGG